MRTATVRGSPSAEDAATQDRHRNLDNLTLSRKEGWRLLVDAPDRVQPERLTRTSLHSLGDGEREDYNRRRRKWHANLGPIKTPQLEELHEDMWDIVDSNDQDGDQAKGAIVIDGFPGLGKTTAVLALAKKFHTREVAAEGVQTQEGHERWPVCRVGLTGNTGMKEFNRAMLEFFHHPGLYRGTAADFARSALDCILSCETRLLIIDDLHFLRWGARAAVEVSNHFKYIANEFPVTLVFIGIGLREKGLYSSGTSHISAILDQTGRRTTPLTMEPFKIGNDSGRREWRNLLLALERKLVLADSFPGMLADDLSDYLFARSTGHMGSLMTLINRGCQRAVRTGVERLDQELLDRVKNDAAAEEARKELEAALAHGRITTKPTSSRRAKPRGRP